MALMRFRDWPLGSKMLVLLLAASTLPLAAATFVVFQRARQEVDQQGTQLLASRTEQVAGEIDAFNRSHLRAVRVVSQYAPVIRYCSDPAERRGAELPAVQGLLDTYATNDDAFRGLAVFDTAGIIRVATETPLLGNNYGFRKYFRDALAGGTVISDIYVSVPEVGSVPSIAYAAPVRDASGSVVGVVALFVRASALWEVINAENGKAGEGSFSVLIDSIGIRIAHSFNEGEVFRPAGPLDPARIEALVAERRFGERTRSYLETPSFVPEEFERARAAAPPDGTAAFDAFSQANRKLNLSVARRLETVPWTLFYLVPKESLQAPVRLLVRDSIVASAAIIALALVAGVLFSRRILKPVQGLSVAAASVTAGDLGARVQTDGNDELGTLGERFNEMAVALERSRDELEDLVRARTAELEGAKGALEDQNQTLELQKSELGRRQKISHAYGRALAVLASDGALAEVINQVLAEAAHATKLVVAVCYRRRDGEQRLRPVACYGVDALPEGGPIGGLALEALKTRTRVVLDPVPSSAELRFEAGFAGGLPRTIALVPIVVGDREVGVLACGGAEPFPQDTLSLLSDITVPIGLTILRAELFEQTNRDADELARRNEEMRIQAEELMAQREELQSQQRELEQKNREVERATQLKSEFLANMSHELRTPLNAVIGFSELLVEETRQTLDERHSRYLVDVLASGRHLLGLINDILDLAKIEAGRVRLDPEPISPTDVVDEARSLLDPVARKRRITIEVVASVSDRAVMADRGKLLQVMLNLISNAVKFSHEGGRVEVGVEDLGAFVRFTVRDHGPGIDGELLPQLFTPFTQGESAFVKKHQGTGLGLAISKRLVEQHGGTIEVETSAEGSLFAFTIPVADEHPVVAPAALPAAVVTSSRPLVLVIDDDPAVGSLLRSVLEPAGYRVAVSMLGLEGLTVAAGPERPDLIFVDLILPDISGFEVVDALAADPRTKDVPQIVLTAADLAEDERARLKQRVRAFAEKGDLTREAMLAAIDRATGRAPRPKATNGAVTILVVDDHDLNRELARSLIERLGHHVIEAADGVEGVATARAEHPALVLLDLAMPNMDGYEAVRVLKADPVTSSIPVVALTALAMRSDEKRALDAGFDAYLTKPIDRKALNAVVAKYVKAGNGNGHR